MDKDQPQQVSIVEINARLIALAEQRNNALNELAAVQGQLAHAQFQLQQLQVELDKLKSDKEKPPLKAVES